MLRILQIQKNDDFYNYTCELEGDFTVISPNPQTADIVRSKFVNNGIEVNSITIAKFIKDQLNELQISQVLENFRGKSELILLMGAIWKKIGREPNYVKFNRAFNLLTELRSFSLNEQVLDTVLEQYDQDLRESVLWLYRFLVQMEIVDEHQSYFILSEKLRESDLPVEYSSDKHFIFYGFDYLAASQVDLLKSLSLRNEVYVPVYKKVIEKSQGMDWINWFDDHNKEIIDISSEEKKLAQVIVNNFPRGYLSKTLKSLNCVQNDLVLGTKDLTREYIQEISLGDFQSKVQVDIFGHDFEECKSLLLNFMDQDEIETQKLRDFIQQQMQLCVSNQNFRLLKCYFVVLGKMNEWEALSDDNTILNLFDMEILTKAAILDLPRTNLATLDGQEKGQIFSLKQLQDIDGRKVNLILSSNYLSLAAAGSLYTENVEKYLASIGPIRRAEYDLAVLKAKLREFFTNNDVCLLLENGYLEHEPVWSDLLEELPLNTQKVELDFSVKKFSHEFPGQQLSTQKFSASKIQRYLDCPQKYYQQYGLKQSPQVILPSQLSVLDLGQLEHKVIEKYFEKNSQYDEKNHDNLIHYYLEKWCSDKDLAQHIIEEYFIEIKSYTTSIIQLIARLKLELGLEHKFEYEFAQETPKGIFNGSIDCYLFEPNGSKKIILDFKRSNSLFTSYKTILEYEKIQLWFYLKRLIASGEVNLDDEVAIGYIDLSHQENSMLFINQKDFMDVLKKDFGFKKSSLFENFPDQLNTYTEIEESLVDNIINDVSFLPKPKDAKACQYCSVKNICSKEDYGNS